MRTVSAQVDAIYASRTIGTAARVYIENASGVYVNVSDLAGIDWVDSINIGDGVDATVRTADITLKREVFGFSTSPLIESSGLNRGLSPSAPYEPLIQPSRQVKVDVSVHPRDGDPAWLTLFEGVIEEIDFGGRSVEINCSDLGGIIRDTFIEVERVYGYAPGSPSFSGLRLWSASTTFTGGTAVLPNPTRTGFFYEAQGSGSTGATPPTWPTTVGATVVDGSVTWECIDATAETGTPLETIIQHLLNDNAPGVTLYTPTSPGWMLKPYLQRREPLFAAIRTLAAQIGWDVRYLWRSATSQFELTLFEPERSKTVADRTFGPGEVLEVTRASQSIMSVRNVCRVVYSDSASIDADGYPVRVTYEASDAGSISKYGRRFMEIQEEESSAIDTAVEAAKMADAAVSDLATPLVDQTVSLQFFPFAELGDLYTFSANGLQYDTDQTLAVVGINHRIDARSWRTELQTRGKPAGGFKSWIQKAAKPGKPTHRVTGFDGSLSVSATQIVGGAGIVLTRTDGPTAKHWEGAEIHMSTSPGFVPSSATKIAVGRSRTFEASHLVPGATYYAKAVPFGYNDTKLVKAPPTDEVSFVAGRGQAGHLTSEVNWGRVPLNGGFEARIDTAGMPDHWTSSQYGSQVLVNEGTAALSGNRYVAMYCAIAAASDASMSSEYFDVMAGEKYRLEFWRKCVAGTGSNFSARVWWFTSAKAFISASTVSVDLADSVSSWVKSSGIVTAPATAKYGFMSLSLTRSGGTEERHIHIDSVSVTPYALGVNENWATPTLLNGWVNFGGGWDAVGYFKDPLGIVHIRGLVKDGSTAVPIFELPAGYRPAAGIHLATVGGNAYATLQVLASGEVQMATGSNTWLSLHCSFRAA